MNRYLKGAAETLLGVILGALAGLAVVAIILWGID